MHEHEFNPTSITLFACDCGAVRRLASQAEAVSVHDNGTMSSDGPVVWKHNMVLVPLTFDIWKVA